MSRNILVIGHSHIEAIRRAAIARREADPLRPRTRTMYVLDPAFGDNRESFSDTLKAAILDQIERHQPIIASVIRGNGHAAMSMVARRRFDFELSGDDALPLDDQAEIVSEAEVRDMLLPWLKHDLRELRELRELVGPFWHLESPPPVRRSDWIIERAERYFTDDPDFHRFGVAEAGVRYRVWRLANRIIKQELDSMGCGYVRVPSNVCGEAGLLRPSYGRDATHGGQQFGEEMIQALEQAAT
jgi:hypothetical protein